jgi:4-alpha-glucanotransferase
MNDDAVRELARRAGIAVNWTNYANKHRRVSLDTIRRILAALGLHCETADELAHSQSILNESRLPPLITATAGQAIDLPLMPAAAPPRVRLIQEDGVSAVLDVRHVGQSVSLPGVQAAGYHTLEIGQTSVTLAVAPPRCMTIADIAPGERMWGLAAQIYGLRSPGDCGIGDMAGVMDLARAAAPLRADALALSPIHALFSADPSHFSPYSPSSRLFYNPLHADASSLFGEARVANARSGSRPGEREASLLIDWTESSRVKLSIFRRLFDDFSATDLGGGSVTDLAADFAKFRAARGPHLEAHALFEAVHAARLQADSRAWNWRDWPSEWRDPRSTTVKTFCEKNQREVLFHVFLQWIADRSIAGAQQEAKRSGMRIGLITDLAIGTNSAGSYSWTNQSDILGGLQIGAPPDLFNAKGQNWELTTFSPRALSKEGFAPFIATLRACMRHAGGVRIDHAMGFMRLWVIPSGAEASDGAYLAFPIDSLLRLSALESQRHRTIVIGEDLGTVPSGFRDRLAAAGIYGMCVLWFERDKEGFATPPNWPAAAVAMTSTHDLPTVAGWWRGEDLEMRAQHGLLVDVAGEQAARRVDRDALWSAFQAAEADEGELPGLDEAPRVADAAVGFVAQTPSQLALLPLEDALALEDQPNLPGTIDQHPNWRRRYGAELGETLADLAVRTRLDPLTKRAAR